MSHNQCEWPWAMANACAARRALNAQPKQLWDDFKRQQLLFYIDIRCSLLPAYSSDCLTIRTAPTSVFPVASNYIILSIAGDAINQLRPSHEQFRNWILTHGVRQLAFACVVQHVMMI